MRTRDRVREYVANNPDATYRQIQAALGLSSVSQVSHHLKLMTVDGKPSSAVVDENARLKRQVAKLQERLRKIAELADIDE
jgi:hypothetical protein